MNSFKAMITVTKHSGIYTLNVQQKLPISLKEAWGFFSMPSNLSKITPQNMGFVITSGKSHKTYQGQIISYKISPFPGIKINWITEITSVSENHYFVDEQRFGPYSMWHHEHHFEATEGGTLISDKVSYKIPLGFLGHLAHKLLIKKKLIHIFEYRYNILQEIFQSKSHD